MTQQQRAEIQKQIDVIVDNITNSVQKNSSDYEKALFVYEYLVKNCSYDLEAKDNQNIISVFLHKSSVCQGYANAAQYLLTELGIQSSVVTGCQGEEAHTWILMRLDNEYYYSDPTLGDAIYIDKDRNEDNYVNHAFFAITTEELLKTHSPKTYYKLPECTSIVNNYYVQEGAYIDEWDVDAIGNIYAEAYNDKKKMASIKFSSDYLYEKATVYFVGQYHILEYCHDINAMNYIANYKQNILTFKFD